MHGDKPTIKEKAADQISRPRKANECINAVKHLKSPEMLFDEFWREGELALLFGAAGTGKSILALQIAEAIARGRRIYGFKMSEKRQKVLYVDLNLSERQFQGRSYNDGKYYKFSENLYREAPKDGDNLCEWLRKRIADSHFRAVVIDDLSAIRQTYDGTRETLKLMRELRKLTRETGVSILVLTGAREHGLRADVSEADMQRSRVLCDAADSVFAIGRQAANPADGYLIQTRSRSAPIHWTIHNGPGCRVARLEDGLLGMAFDPRFVRKLSQEEIELICNIKWAHKVGATFRELAKEHGISKSRAERLYKKWTPEMEKGFVNVEPEDEESEPPVVTGGLTLGETNTNGSNETYYGESNGDRLQPPATAGGSDKIPWGAGMGHRLITDLKRGVDHNDMEIFIESEDERGKPLVWYQRGNKGIFNRWQRDMWGITGKEVGRKPILR